MRHTLYILLFSAIVAIRSYASGNPPTYQVDSIMRQVIANAALYERMIDSYEAEVYVKGRTEVHHKNFLMNFAYLIFPVEHHPADAVFEMVSHSRYDAPNQFHHDIKAINGSRLSAGNRHKDVFEFINLNIYSPTIYNKEIITPLASNAFKYYSFELVGITDSANLILYEIRFTPKQWSQKLLSGILHITDKYWTIDKIDLSGHSTFSEFNLVISFSRDMKRFILPEKADLHVCYHALGNKLTGDYHSSFKYQSVAWVEEEYEDRRKRSLNLTRYYQLSSDTIPIIRDTTFWITHRDEPLYPDEQALYSPALSAIADSTGDSAQENEMQRYLDLTEKLTSSVSMNYNTTRIKYSGLLNPFQMGYSGDNGFTYRQQVRISKTFKDDRQLRLHPELGYIFKKKELRLKMTMDWEYLPERLGALSLTLANDNKTYSSETKNKVNAILKDSSFNFDDLKLNYYKHYYAELRNRIELFNGFQLQAGISYHRRIPSGVTDEFRYHDFIPAIGLQYTPRQYYWMDGHRKEYLYSYYPTFTVEIAHAIPGVMHSQGNYGRFEADIHQRVNLGLSRRLSYHLSGGLFFNQRSTYFADFHYFAKKFFPESWKDRFGGIFHNLQGDWYNASDKYLQGHLLYESPFLLLRLLRPKLHRYLVSERLYISQLWTPVLPNYTELGYGLGNDLLNIALFVGFEEFKYQSFGIKLALELF